MANNEKAGSLVESVFGHTDLYSILQVSREATAEEVKRAYRRLALKHHPDRGGSKETFQALSLVYCVLSDEEKRRIYDETGSLEDDSDGGNEESFAFWNDYFRALFPALTTQKIDDFARTYVGSEEEKRDVLERYAQFTGDLPSVMECVMFAEEGDERRICAIIDAAIDDKDVLRYPRYEETRVGSEEEEEDKESSKKKKKKGSKRGRKRTIKHFDCDDDDNDNENNNNDDNDNEEGEDEEEEEDNEESDTAAAKKDKKKQAPKKKAAAAKKKKQSGGAGDMDALVAAIRGKRESRSASLWQSVLSRYGEGEGAEEPLIDDEAFERARPQKKTKSDEKDTAKSDKPAKANKTSKPKKK